MQNYAKYNLNYLLLIIIDSNLIELKDGIYRFSNGECTPHCE